MKKAPFFFCLLLSTSFFTSTALSQVNSHVNLNHIAVFVKDLKTTTDFYEDILGLQLMEEPFHDGKHTWFKIGEHAQLHLIQGAATIVAHDKNGHLCFSVPDINTFIAHLNKSGINYEDWPGNVKKINLRVDGVPQIYFKDPEGNWIEVNDDKY